MTVLPGWWHAMSSWDLETSIYVTTDGNVWTFEHNRHTAAEILRGRQPDRDRPGMRIYHSHWKEVAPDA